MRERTEDQQQYPFDDERDHVPVEVIAVPEQVPHVEAQDHEDYQGPGLQETLRRGHVVQVVGRGREEVPEHEGHPKELHLSEMRCDPVDKPIGDEPGPESHVRPLNYPKAIYAF